MKIEINEQNYKDLEVAAIVQRESIETIVNRILTVAIATGKTKLCAVWPPRAEHRILKGAK